MTDAGRSPLKSQPLKRTRSGADQDKTAVGVRVRVDDSAAVHEPLFKSAARLLAALYLICTSNWQFERFWRA